MLRIRLSCNRSIDCSGAFGGRITALSLRRGAIEFNKHGVINVRTECAFNGFKIGAKAIAS
jgi:hypothetical protein